MTNADLLAGLGLDLVLVSCPMGGTRDAIAMGWDLPLRGFVRARLAAEVAAIRSSGTPVLTLQPSREARAPMGSARGRGCTSSACCRSAYTRSAAGCRQPSRRRR